MTDAVPAPAVAAPSDPIEVVEAFLGALERFDTEAAIDLLADDAVYQNVPLPAARGKAEIARQLRWAGTKGSSFEVVMHNIAANGGIVLTERTDVLGAGPVQAGFWVCGTFEVRDGKIVLWRDRYDHLDLTWGIVKGVARAIRGRLDGRRSAPAPT